MREIRAELTSGSFLDAIRGIASAEFIEYGKALERMSGELWAMFDRDGLSALNRAMLLAQYAQELVGNLTAGYGVQCREGCAHCCHLQVEVQPWEADALAQHIAHDGPLAVVTWLAAMKVRAEEVRGLNANAYRALNLRCPFLADSNRCTVYLCRPVACVAYHSVDAEACARGMVDPSGPIPFIGEAWVAPNMLRIGAMRAIEKSGGTAMPAELHAAMVAALERQLAKMLDGEG